MLSHFAPFLHSFLEFEISIATIRIVCLHLVWLLVLGGSYYDRPVVKGYLATFYSPGQRNRKKTKEKRETTKGIFR